MESGKKKPKHESRKHERAKTQNTRGILTGNNPLRSHSLFVISLFRVFVIGNSLFGPRHSVDIQSLEAGLGFGFFPFQGEGKKRPNKKENRRGDER